jgi:hypothetical protein
MNKKAVITTLRKDFEIIMMQPAKMQHGYMSRNIDSVIIIMRFHRKKDLTITLPIQPVINL